MRRGGPLGGPRICWPSGEDCAGHQENCIARISTPTYRIEFGCSIPFTNIPLLIEDGFDDIQRPRACRDQKVLAHYNAGRDCLAQALGDPLCDAIVLTFANSSVTPALPMYTWDFEAGRRKDPGHLPVALNEISSHQRNSFLCNIRI